MLKKLTEHIRATYKNGGNMCTSIAVEDCYRILALTAPTPVDPNNIMAKEIVQMHIFDKKLDALIKCKELLDSNIQNFIC